MEITTNEKKVCENCHFIKRPFGRNLNDDFYCYKSQKFVGPIQKHSCENWREWQPNDVLI
jgi:hypothetical protein